MKKTLNINLNNVAFIIDEDAYEVLRKYLADIAGHFQDDLDRDDIMADIEGRIAELLGERLQRGKEVVTLADVQEVVAIMGHPSQFADDEEQPETQAAKKKKRPRRFYRDPEGAVLGGVCGGIAARFGWDVSVVRLALAGITLLSMVVGGGWFFLLAYFLLWIVAPAAVTPSQRLEMQGEEVTVDNIKAEFDNWKAYVAGEEFKRSTRTVGQRIGQVLVGALKVCLGVAGALLVAAVVFVVFIAVVSLLSVGGALSIAGLAEVLPDFVWSWPDNWDVVLLLVVSGLLLVGCPLFALVYALVRGASGHRSKSKVTYWVALLLWLAGLFMLIGVLRESRWPSQMHFHWNSGTALTAPVVHPVAHSVQQQEADEEPVTDQWRDVPPFRAVDLRGCFDVEITQSPNRTLMVSASDKRLPGIVTRVSGDTLYIWMDEEVKESYTFRSFDEARDALRRNRVSLSADCIESIRTEGVARIVGTTPLKGRKLDLHVEGMSKVDLQLDMKQTVGVHVEGMGSMNLRGRCERTDLYVEGMSTLDAEGLQATHARLRSEGICHLKAYATGSVDARAEGMGKIVCYGKPEQVTVAEDGLARVKVK